MSHLRARTPRKWKPVLLGIAFILGVAFIIMGALAFLAVETICVNQGHQFTCFNAEDYLSAVRIFPYRYYSYVFTPIGLVLVIGAIALRLVANRTFPKNSSGHTKNGTQV